MVLYLFLDRNLGHGLKIFTLTFWQVKQNDREVFYVLAIFKHILDRGIEI